MVICEGNIFRLLKCKHNLFWIKKLMNSFSFCLNVWKFVHQVKKCWFVRLVTVQIYLNNMSGYKTVYSKNKEPCFVMAFSIFYVIRNSIIYYIQTNSTGYTLSKSRKNVYISIYWSLELIFISTQWTKHTGN